MASPDDGPRWVSRLVVEGLHADLLLTHGGLTGLRDEAALDSALARARQRHAYDEAADLPSLAASYGFGLARNHPFNDGNKRVALVTMAVFLELNGLELTASEADVVTVMVALAAGSFDEPTLADWIRANVRPLSTQR